MFGRMVSVVLLGDSQLTDSSPRNVTKLGPRLRHRGHAVETLRAGQADADRDSGGRGSSGSCWEAPGATPVSRSRSAGVARERSERLWRALGFRRCRRRRGHVHRRRRRRHSRQPAPWTRWAWSTPGPALDRRRPAPSERAAVTSGTLVHRLDDDARR